MKKKIKKLPKAIAIAIVSLIPILLWNLYAQVF